MADVVPAAQTGAIAPASGGSAPVAVTVTSDAGTALKLSEGALLQAVAANRAIKGEVTVTTASGETFQLRAQPGMALPTVPPGSQLTVQGTASGQLYLVAVNGRPLAGVTMAAMNAPLPGLMLPLPASDGQGAAGRSGAGPTVGAPGQNPPPGPLVIQPSPSGANPPPAGLTATVIRPAQPAATPPLAGTPPAVPPSPPPPPAPPGTAAPPGLPPDLPAGSRLTVRIAGIELPAAATPTVPSAMAGPAAVATAVAQARAAALMPRMPPPLPAATSPAATVLPANVVAHPPGGNAVVQTAIGTLAVPTPADLPVGTQLTLEVVGKPLPPLPTTTTPPTQPGLTNQGWPALSQALDVLATANQPQALEQLLRAVPQADTRLAAAMAAFAGSLRSGEGKGTLPENSVRGLEKAGRKDLVARLVGDLDALREETGRPVGNGEWRTYTMPFLSGGVVEPVRLFVRRPPDGEGTAAGAGRGDRNNDHRFVVDLNLSHMGRLQLDGLVRREEKLFDLIIRTGAPLDAEIRRDILGIFTNASELVGTKGTVSFQAGGRWLDFPPAPPAPTRIEV